MVWDRPDRLFDPQQAFSFGAAEPPDVVAGCDESEVARRWLMICLHRKNRDGNPLEPTTAELDTIRNYAERKGGYRVSERQQHRKALSPFGSLITDLRRFDQTRLGEEPGVCWCLRGHFVVLIFEHFAWFWISENAISIVEH